MRRRDGLLAVAVSGRGLVDPGEPVLAAGRRGLHARPRRVRDDARLRRPAVPVRRSTSRASQGSAERIGFEPPDASRDRGAVGARARARGRARGSAAPLLDARASGRRALRDRARQPDPGLDRGGARAWSAARLAAPPAAFGAVAAPRHEVDELRRQHGGRGRGEGARRRRRRLRRRGRDRARRPGDEHLVAGGRRSRDAVARGRHPRRRDARRPARARRARRDGSSRRASSRSSGSSRADEVFTSSSVREVMPVVALDGHRSSAARPPRRSRRRSRERGDGR